MKAVIKCLIVDDESIARKGLRNYALASGDIEIAGECKSAVEIPAVLEQKRVDLIFLDIEMPHLKGIDYRPEGSNAPFVILTTAYPEYAIKGYELDIVDYLLKPFSLARFQESINKARRLIEWRSTQIKEHLYIRANREMIKLAIADILYLQAMENYVIFVTSEEKHIVNTTLQKAAEMVSSHKFTQIHKSFIVNHNFITRVTGDEVELGELKVPLSRNFKKNVLRIFK